MLTGTVWLLVVVAQAAEHKAGLEHYGARQYAAAAESFRAAMVAERSGTPEYAESAVLRGQSLYLLGRYEDAILALQAAPRTNESAYMLGNSYLRVRDVPNSVKAFAEMFGVPAGSAAAHLLTAQMMLRQELNEDAEAQLGQALALDARLPQAHYLLGELFLFRGEAEQGAAQFKAEIALNPDSAMAYYKLGDAYGRQSLWAAMIPVLQKSIWLNADNSGPYVLLGKAYSQQKELGNAEGMLRRAVQLDPRNASAHYLLGQTLMQMGRAEEGRAMVDVWRKLKQ